MIKEIIFLGLVGITLVGGFMAVWLKNVFYNALSLILCLFGVASLFIYLNSEFLAIMEVIIYIGAISIAILFAIMLSRPGFREDKPRNPKKVLRALLLAAALFLALQKTFRATQWPQVNTEGDYSIRAIGKSLLGANALPFEVVSLVLLIAIIGALLLSGKKKEAS